MKEILLVSNTELDPQIELLRTELTHHGYSMSFPVTINKALEHLRQYSYTQILINASQAKLESLELLREIKEIFKSTIKVFIYLPNSSASEGSKYGQYSAEVEDEFSLLSMVDKLAQGEKHSCDFEENFISIYALSGGSGTSLISILLAYALGKRGHDTLLLESSPTATSLRDALALESKPALLTRDRSREQDQVKDSDWFSGFISRSPFLRETHYLHLFASMADRANFMLRASIFVDNITNQLAGLSQRINSYNIEELATTLRIPCNNLQLLSHELSGNSRSLFDEIVQPGAQFAKTFIADLGSDIQSPINRQILKLSKSLIIVMRDNTTANLRESFNSQKKYLEDYYNLNIIPVLAPGHHRYSDYYRFTASNWESLLGVEPLIFPYLPEEVSSFLLDHEELEDQSALLKFSYSLLERAGFTQTVASRKSLMDFLVRNS